MWQRFTERARRVIFFSQEEAAKLNQGCVDTQHLLMGMIRESDSVAALILGRLGVGLETIRERLAPHLVRGAHADPEIQLTASAKRVVDLAYDEAQELNNQYIGTEHLLLGLIREEKGAAGQVLKALGASLERAREAVAALQEEAATPPPPEPAADDLARRMHRLLPDDEADRLAHASNLMALRALAERGCRPRQTTEALPLAVEIARSICDGMEHLPGIEDLTADQAAALIYLARILKDTLHLNRAVHQNILPGKTLAMVFEKPSLRTRVSFEAGMFQLGGHAIYLQPSDISMGKRETIADVARNLDRMVDGVMARVFAHGTIRELAAHSRVPVINGLCDREHPCQALADLLTVWEKRESLVGLKIVYVGDGNNVAHSLLLLGAMLGAQVVIACPEGYAPDPAIVALARERAGAESVVVTHDPQAACADADVVYTDVWASMGQEAEAAERAAVFAPFQVNAALVAGAKPDFLFMHCLPAHRGEEVSAEVMDGPNSVVFDQAENRLHAQKAVLAVLLG
jgi:ornithine carbamoyltransferase